MYTLLVILLSLIVICLLALIGWLTRIFDLLAVMVGEHLATRAGLDMNSLTVKMSTRSFVDRIAPGHGKKWSEKVWPDLVAAQKSKPKHEPLVPDKDEFLKH